MFNKKGSQVAFFVNKGPKYTNVLESFQFNNKFKYANESESILFSDQYNLDFFCTETRKKFAVGMKITIDHVQILRILVQKSTQKKILRDFS